MKHLSTDAQNCLILSVVLVLGILALHYGGDIIRAIDWIQRRLGA